ncbi:MAG: hypothetical protein ACPGXX_19810 [Planctomycetaceae bacterium]
MAWRLLLIVTGAALCNNCSPKIMLWESGENDAVVWSAVVWCVGAGVSHRFEERSGTESRGRIAEGLSHQVGTGS